VRAAQVPARRSWRPAGWSWLRLGGCDDGETGPSRWWSVAANELRGLVEGEARARRGWLEDRDEVRVLRVGVQAELLVRARAEAGGLEGARLGRAQRRGGRELGAGETAPSSSSAKARV